MRKYDGPSTLIYVDEHGSVYRESETRYRAECGLRVRHFDTELKGKLWLKRQSKLDAAWRERLKL